MRSLFYLLSTLSILLPLLALATDVVTLTDEQRAAIRAAAEEGKQGAAKAASDLSTAADVLAAARTARSSAESTLSAAGSAATNEQIQAAADAILAERTAAVAWQAAAKTDQEMRQVACRTLEMELPEKDSVKQQKDLGKRISEALHPQ